MDKRVKFDFEIDFTNGGGIQGQDFRLDIEGDDISDEELAKYIVRDMRLLMVGEVRILNKQIIEEKHKRQPAPVKPQFIYVLKPTRLGMLTERPTPEEVDTVSRHFAYFKDLTEKGVMILMGRTQNKDESTFGIAVFEAEDEAAARGIMENDPAVVGGVMTATLYPYRIALMRDHLSLRGR
ncbi:MAG TPA: YciI family protein [Anaerolineales bacterium]|nr:YciI family protein [Anaerolineales bacterium]